MRVDARAWLVVACLAIASCAGSPPPRELTPAQRARELAVLRAKIDEARAAAKADRHMSLDRPLEERALLGMSTTQVAQALGQPSVCSESDLELCERGDWIYHFFHLPRLWLGGGIHLRLRFDEGGRCVETKWLATQ